MYHEYGNQRIHCATQSHGKSRIVLTEWSTTYQQARAELEALIGKEETYLYCRTLPVRTLSNETAYEAALRVKIAELKNGGVQ